MANSSSVQPQRKLAFITGGSSGLGLGTCERFLQEGARVMVADMKSPPQSTLDSGAIFQEVDLPQRDQIVAALERAEAMLAKLHVIIHNAARPEEASIWKNPAKTGWIAL